MVKRKLDLIRYTTQPIPPERQLPRDRALPLALVPQNTPLPQRVIGILHRKPRQNRRTPRTPRRIELPKVATQRRQRPAVPRYVMQHHQQHMLALPKHKQMRTQRNLARKIKPNTRRSRQRSRSLSLAHRRCQQLNTSRTRRQNLLPRHSPTLREDRAQALVPLDNVPQRSLQRHTVQLPPQPNRQRDRVRRAPSLQTIQKPQPALRIRQRNLRRTGLRTKRRSNRSTIPKPPHQSRYRRSLEQAADRHLNSQRRPHTADQTRRKQRMAPKRKEVVVDPNTRNTQNLRKQRAQNLLLRRARQAASLRDPHLRRRQRATVQLPVRRQR